MWHYPSYLSSDYEDPPPTPTAPEDNRPPTGAQIKESWRLKKIFYPVQKIDYTSRPLSGDHNPWVQGHPAITTRRQDGAGLGNLFCPHPGARKGPFGPKAVLVKQEGLIVMMLLKASVGDSSPCRREAGNGASFSQSPTHTRTHPSEGQCSPHSSRQRTINKPAFTHYRMVSTPHKWSLTALWKNLFFFLPTPSLKKQIRTPCETLPFPTPTPPGRLGSRGPPPRAVGRACGHLRLSTEWAARPHRFLNVSNGFYVG